MESGQITLPAHRVSTSQGAPPNLYPEFALGFHYIGVIDETTGHGTELNLQSPSSPRLPIIPIPYLSRGPP